MAVDRVRLALDLETYDDTSCVPYRHRRRRADVPLAIDIGFARSRGARLNRSTHHPENAAAIALHRHLGFVDEQRSPEATT